MPKKCNAKGVIYLDYGIMVYSSTTTTNRAKKLAEKRIRSLKVFQIPTSVGIKGCNYSLRCEFQEFDELRKISEEYGLNIKAMIKETVQDGQKIYIMM